MQSTRTQQGAGPAGFDGARRKPTGAPSAGLSRPDPCRGRRRARPFRLLPALALLLAALGLSAALPAQAQTASWSTTLTVDLDTSHRTIQWGCDDKDPVMDACSTALTDNDFVSNGTTYTITGLYLMGNRVLVPYYTDKQGRTRYRRSDDKFTVWQVILDFDKATPTTAWTLQLGSARLSNTAPLPGSKDPGFRRLSSSKVEEGRIVLDLPNARWNWYRSADDKETYWEEKIGGSWTDGQQVLVTLTWPAKSPAVSLSAAPNPVAEGSWVSVQASLAWELKLDVTIPLVVTRDTSETGDHGMLTSLRIPAGFRSATTAIATAHDADDDDENFTVALGALPSGLKAGSPSSVQVTIDDDDTNQQPVTDFSSGGDSDPHAALIAQMREWRSDPQWSSHKSHTDRWDRALLAFGQTVPDVSLTPMTAAEAQAFADSGMTRWERVAQALKALEAVNSGTPDPQDPGQPLPTLQLVPPALHGDLLGEIYGWREDPDWRTDKAHTDRWDRALLAFGEPVSDTSLAPMTDSEAQGFADTAWGTRWVPVAQALNVVVTGTSGADTLTGTSSGELLAGLGGADTLSGQGGDDELRGGDGDDGLSGGGGADRFVFFSGDTGANTITDFEAGDVIVLKGSGWSSVSDIVASVQAIGSGDYRYTLASGLTVETTNNRSLFTDDFVAE